MDYHVIFIDIYGYQSMNTNNSRNLLIFQETVQSNFDCFV